eukprot:11160231-Lingulodinium_polyedra.AAC.1
MSTQTHCEASMQEENEVVTQASEKDSDTKESRGGACGGLSSSPDDFKQLMQEHEPLHADPDVNMSARA